MLAARPRRSRQGEGAGRVASDAERLEQRLGEARCERTGRPPARGRATAAEGRREHEARLNVLPRLLRRHVVGDRRERRRRQRRRGRRRRRGGGHVRRGRVRDAVAEQVGHDHRVARRVERAARPDVVPAQSGGGVARGRGGALGTRLCRAEVAERVGARGAGRGGCRGPPSARGRSSSSCTASKEVGCRMTGAPRRAARAPCTRGCVGGQRAPLRSASPTGQSAHRRVGARGAPRRAHPYAAAAGAAAQLGGCARHDLAPSRGARPPWPS